MIDGSAKLEELDFVVMGDESEPEDIPLSQLHPPDKQSQERSEKDDLAHTFGKKAPTKF